MIVVSDTAPINYLLLIGQVQLLPALFGRVVAPEAVIDELRHPAAPEVVRRWSETLPSWVEVRRPAAPIQERHLDAGEAEAIALASELKADVLLMDDRFAKRIAIKHHVKVTGTLGVLETAAQRGLIDLAATFQSLRKTTFRCNDEILNEILDRNRPR